MTTSKITQLQDYPNVISKFTDLMEVVDSSTNKPTPKQITIANLIYGQEKSSLMAGDNISLIYNDLLGEIKIYKLGSGTESSSGGIQSIVYAVSQDTTNPTLTNSLLSDYNNENSLKAIIVGASCSTVLIPLVDYTLSTDTPQGKTLTLLNATLLAGDYLYIAPSANAGVLNISIASPLSNSLLVSSPHINPTISIYNASSPNTQFLKANGTWSNTLSVSGTGITNSIVPNNINIGLGFYGVWNSSNSSVTINSNATAYLQLNYYPFFQHTVSAYGTIIYLNGYIYWTINDTNTSSYNEGAEIGVTSNSSSLPINNWIVGTIAPNFEVSIYRPWSGNAPATPTGNITINGVYVFPTNTNNVLSGMHVIRGSLHKSSFNNGVITASQDCIITISIRLNFYDLFNYGLANEEVDLWFEHTPVGGTAYRFAQTVGFFKQSQVTSLYLNSSINLKQGESVSIMHYCYDSTANTYYVVNETAFGPGVSFLNITEI